MIIGECKIDDMKSVLTQLFSDMQENAEMYNLIASPNFESQVLAQAVTMTLEHADSETKKPLPSMAAKITGGNGIVISPYMSA